MKLATYLARKAMSRKDFAAAIDVDVITVGRYLSGARRPSWEVMARIATATDGAVTADDFLDRPPRRPSGPGRVAA